MGIKGVSFYEMRHHRPSMWSSESLRMLQRSLLHSLETSRPTASSQWGLQTNAFAP